VIAAVTRYRSIILLVRTNGFLLVALAVLTLWALSNRIYFGPFLIVSYPLPDLFLTTLGSWFRSSGRFFWPVAWLIVGLGIAGALRNRQRFTMLGLFIIGVGLQWIDVSLLRSKIAVEIASAPQSAFGSRQNAAIVEDEIQSRGRVVLAPSMYCMTPDWSNYSDSAQYLAATEIQLMAARANATSNSAYLGRPNKDCERERQTTLKQLVGDGVLVAISQPKQFDRTDEAKKFFKCQDFTLGVICKEG